MTSEEYRKNIERDILKIIESRLASGKMDTQKAKEIAQFLLRSFKPPLTFDQIYKAVQNFDDHFPELAPAVNKVVNAYDDEVKRIVHHHAGNLIKQGRIPQARFLINQALSKNVKLGR